MALTDNTETLEQILEEVYALPSRSSGSSVDATITFDTGVEVHACELTPEVIEYDFAEIKNVYEKLANKQGVNVQIFGTYAYASSYAYHGAFQPVNFEFVGYSGGYFRLQVRFIVSSYYDGSHPYMVELCFTSNDEQTAIDSLFVTSTPVHPVE